MFGGLGWSQKLSPLITSFSSFFFFKSLNTNSTILKLYREFWFIISHIMWYDQIDLLVNIFCAVEFIFFACTVTSMFILSSIVLPLLYYKGHGHVLVFNIYSRTCVFSITLAVMISYWTVASHGRVVLTSPLIIIHWPLFINHTDLNFCRSFTFTKFCN